MAPGTPSPRRTRVARALAVGLALGLVLGLAAAAACVRWPLPHATVERLLGERVRRDVRIEGDARVCLCPLVTLTVDAIEIGPPPWSRQARFARLEGLALAIHPLSLLRGAPRIASLSIRRGDLVLEREADGRASWQRPAATGEAGTSVGPPVIERLEVRDLAFRLIDPARGIDLSGSVSLDDGRGRSDPDAPAPERRLELAARGTLGGLPATVSAQGRDAPADDGSPQPISLRARVGEGRLAFDGHVDTLASLKGLAGEVRVSGPALAALGGLVGAVLPRTPAFRIAGRIAHADGRWRLAIARATVGGSDLRGEVAFVPARGGAAARLDGRLASTRMRLSDLGRSVGFGEAGRRGRVLPDVRLDLPSLRGMDAALAVAVARLELGGGTAPVTDLAASLRLQRGVLAIGALKADVAGGRLGGGVRIDASRSPGRVSADLSIRQVELARRLPALRGEPPLASRMNAEVSIAGRGDSVAAVLANADGRARIALGPGHASRLLLELAGVDVAESLAVLATRDRPVRLDCGLAEIAIERGTIAPRVLFVDTRDTIVVGEGRASLADERLALRLRALPRDASPLTLRAPIDVGGSFAAPRVSLDRTRIAGTVVASLVLGALVTPIAALLPLLDFGEGDPPSPCTGRYGAKDALGSDASAPAAPAPGRFRSYPPDRGPAR